jgi:hypothetical protein
MSISIETKVSCALDNLTVSIQVLGPISTGKHITYVIIGLADTTEEIIDLCCCILGFLGGIIEVDLSIDSAIGEGMQASDNLMKVLRHRLHVGEVLTDEQKKKNRDPLLHELICHVLVLIHQRCSILPAWLAEIQSCRPPHLSANDSGLDLVALGVEKGTPLPIIGEAKAYEKDPLNGLDAACEKFTQILQGEYNDEIREALKKSLDVSHHFTKEQLAANIWLDIGRFGALVAHDQEHGFDVNAPCTKPQVLKQDPKRLFFIASPFSSMRKLFDNLTDVLKALAESLGV